MEAGPEAVLGLGMMVFFDAFLEPLAAAAFAAAAGTGGGGGGGGGAACVSVVGGSRGKKFENILMLWLCVCVFVCECDAMVYEGVVRIFLMMKWCI